MFSVNNVSFVISLSAHDIVGIVIRASSAMLIKIFASSSHKNLMKPHSQVNVSCNEV